MSRVSGRVIGWVALLVLPLVSLGQQSLQGELADAREQERGILGQLDEIDRQVVALQEETDRLQEKIRQQEIERRRCEDEVTAATARLDAHKDQAQSRLTALYRLNRRGLARIVFGAEDAYDVRRRMAYLQAIVQADLERMHNFNGMVDKRQKTVDAVQKAIDNLQAIRTEAQIKEAEFRDQRARRATLLDGIRTRRELAIKALSEVSSSRRSLSSKLTRSTGQTQAELGNSFRAAFGKLSWPANGRIIRRFGPYTDPSTSVRGDSHGVDIETEDGTPIRAVFDGTVVIADFVRGYGQTVAVEHGPYTTVYAHANGLRVRRGQPVRQGDVLGQAGATGLTSGPGYQLTFEIRYNGSAQDPLPWLASR